jgi:phytoene dehydrogenase-like protein
MYVVIGAGLAGLSAALTLQEAGHAVTVIDGADRAGGRIATDVIDGFILDRGFQLINLNYPEVKRLGLVTELDFRIAPRTVGVCIGNNRVVIGDPRQASLSAFSSKTGTLRQKISFLKYLASKPAFGEDVQSHLLRCGTGGLYHKVLRPFLQGVFLTDPSQVSAVVGRELIGSFISGKSGIPADGVGSFSQTLAKRIIDLRLNTQVEEIRGNGILTNQGEITATKIILATDLTTAAQLLNADQVTPLIRSTTWYHVAADAPSDSAELILDADHRGPVVNSLVISNLSKSYAPAGQNLISSTTITHASESEVRRHLALMWGSSTENWRLIAKYEINSALPLFAPGKASAKSSKFSDAIYLAGDYLSAPSQNGALASGRLAAQELMLDEGL